MLNVLTFVEKYFYCSRWMVSNPQPPVGILYHVSLMALWLFPGPRESLCHRTGIPFEALVAMVRVSVFLRFTAAQGWLVGQRLRTT